MRRSGNKVAVCLSAAFVCACAATPRSPEPASPVAPMPSGPTSLAVPAAPAVGEGSAQAKPAPAEDHKSATARLPAHNVVPGWFLAGTGPQYFEAVQDLETKRSGRASARLKATADPGSTFGTLMQTVSAAEFLGKRLRLSGFVRTADVKGWAGLWMRVDRKNAPVESFDNMQNRPIGGTTDWTPYAVTLDVQSDATTVNYGVLQQGAGATWIDDLKLEVVQRDVKTTGIGASAAGLDKPMNLDFEAAPPAPTTN